MTVRTIASLGDLRCRTLDDPQKIYNASFWDGERPVYSLVDAPDWLEINAETGELTGVPPNGGAYMITVKATIKDVGEDTIEFVITDGE